MLPTKEAIFKKIHKGDANCSICGHVEETLLHAFYNCPNIQDLAFGNQWGINLEKWGVTNDRKLLEICFNPTPNILQGRIERNKFTMMMETLFYLAWNARNCFTFSKQNL